MNIKRVLKKEILFISFLFSFFRIDGFMLSDQQIILGLQCILSTYKDISEKQEWDVLYQKMLPIATAAILPNTVPLRSMNTEYQTHHAEIIHRNFSTPSIISILETAAPLFFNNRFLALKTIEFLKDHALLQNIPYTVLTKTNLLQPLTKTDIEKLYQPFFDMVTDASLKVNLFKEFFKYHYAKNNYLDFFYENSASLIAYDSTIQTTCKSLIDYAKKQEESHNIVIYVNLSSSIL